MAIFCTISTQYHLFKTYALAESIQKFGGELKVLIIDCDTIKDLSNVPSNVQFNFLEQLNSERAEITKRVYKKDKLRWALKPVYLLYLFSQYNKLIYVDNDIYFYSGYNFIFDELDSSDVLLTPHFYPSSPNTNQTWLEANFRLGLYNAGFIGVNKNAKEALIWWSDCCLYEMKQSYWRGLFDDQKYLDLFPVLFNNVKVIKYRGCNLAGWNDEVVLTKEQVVFVHFNEFTFSKFSNESHIYHSLFSSYMRVLKVFNPEFQLPFKRFNKFKIWNAIYFTCWGIARLLNTSKVVK